VGDLLRSLQCKTKVLRRCRFPALIVFAFGIR
jgi:hypothetical protein